MVELCSVNTLPGWLYLVLFLAPRLPCLDVSDPSVLYSPSPSRVNVPFELKQLNFAMLSHACINLELVNLFCLRMVKCVDFCPPNKLTVSIRSWRASKNNLVCIINVNYNNISISDTKA